jgi:glucokinase
MPLSVKAPSSDSRFAYGRDPASGSRPETIRETNSRHLLRLLRHHMPCSRADLVRISGLTAPTVSSAMDSLQRRGLVKFTGEGSPSGGRPPRILEFNSQYGYVFGADVGGSGVRLAIADLSGKIIGRLTQPIPRGGTPDEVAALITNGMERLLSDHPLANQKILELAVGAPGITDVGRGRVLSAPNLVDWHDVSFADRLRDTTGISTTVENDVNLGAIGEGRCGVARDAQNFVFIAIGSGVGAGIVINGKLFHGANWSAGEVGYMQVPGLPSQDLAVKRLGALESAIGGEGIKKAWLANTNGRRNGAQSPQPTEIFDLAASGNVCAQRILHSTAEHLAQAIVNMNLILDTSLVVLGGGIGSHPGLVEATREALARNEFANPEVLASNLGHDAQLHGAIWLAIQSAEHHGFRRQAVRRANVPRRIRSRVG